MKLELRHISPYLSYELMFDFNVHEVHPHAPMEETRVKILTPDCVQFCLDHCRKLHLRSTSDLIKEIEHNRERFVPIDCLYLMSDYSEFLQSIEDDRYELNTPVRWPYELVQKLFEWHFDVYGLIKEGLAMDINTFVK